MDGTTVILSRRLAWDHTYKPLPRAPVFAGVLGQVKRNRIGDDRIVRISPLPRAPVFVGVLGQV